LEEYFGKQPDMHFKRNLANHAKEIGKNGLSILGDVGAYLHQSKHKDLVDYESSLPTKFNLEEQKQKLFEHHGKGLKILESE
jgi:hypothetical protein